MSDLMGRGPLVEEDWILIDDYLKSSDESLRDPQINHEVEGLLLVGLPGEDQSSVVLSQMLVFKVRDHLAGQDEIA